MKYFTDTISVTLAEKLKEKGMPVKIEQEWYLNGMAKAEKDCHKPMTKYCEVFDWLMEKDIVMEQTRLFGLFHIRPIIFGENKELMPIKDFCKAATWHEAAEAAIEKALTLI